MSTFFPSRARPLLLAASLVFFAPSAQAGTPMLTFTTLGTFGGAIPDAKRSQPAGLLRYGAQAILVDAGDGVSEQLAKVGVSLGAVHSVILSHLHFDHTGGLFAFLGLYYQVRNTAPITIYGPLGTKRLVDGLLAAMQPAADVGSGLVGQKRRPPEALVQVVEIRNGSKVTIGSVVVTAVVNSHFSFPPGSPQAAQFQSLSLRFDAPGRVISYTGDTGPSTNVERLAQGSDLLVSEIIDPDESLAAVRAARPDIADADAATFLKHFREQHLTADQVGLLAQRSGARFLVVSHDTLSPDAISRARIAIASHFPGSVTFANDLDSF